MCFVLTEQGQPSPASGSTVQPCPPSILQSRMLLPLMFFSLLVPCQAFLVTSCWGRDSAWSRQGVATALRSWLRSGVTEVREGGQEGSSEGGVHSWLWDPLTRTVHSHYAVDCLLKHHMWTKKLLPPIFVFHFAQQLRFFSPCFPRCVTFDHP